MTRKFKDSGVEWIGEIPEGWNVVRIKGLLGLRKGKTPQPKPKQANEDTPPLRPVVDMAAVRTGVANFASISGTVVVENDLLILGDGSKSGEILKSPMAGYLGSTLFKVEISEPNVNSQFLYYRLTHLSQVLMANQIGMGIPHLDTVSFYDSKLELPPLCEQKAIANYLDAKTKSIDDKVENLKARVKLLAELKQALIYETVTGKNVVGPKKDSGVEWIGEIPEGWGCTKLKRVLKSVSAGSTPSTDNQAYYQNEGFPWVTIADMSQVDVVVATKQSLSELALSELNLAKVQKGALLYSMYGSIGAVAEAGVDCCTNQAILALTPVSDMAYSKYLKYSLIGIKPHVLTQASTNIQPNLNQRKIINFIFALPPLSEQKTIADYLDDKVSKIDHIIETANKQIELLGELRQALIYEIVTGKREVPAEYYSVA